MSALSEALEHSQAKALAALFKAYTRRSEEPDDGLFLAMIQGVGLDDDVQAKFLVRCWRIMRDNPDALPATNGTAPSGGEQKMSEAQRRLIGVLVDERKLEAPDLDGLTFAKASELISAIKAGTYKPQEWQVPF